MKGERHTGKEREAKAQFGLLVKKGSLEPFSLELKSNSTIIWPLNLRQVSNGSSLRLGFIIYKTEL